MPELDMTDRYNTMLSAPDQQRFDTWAAKQGQRASSYDYDMQGWWKENGSKDLTGAHLTDKYKKPNHPTFSDQSIYHGTDGQMGGHWIQEDDKSWSFAPGSANMRNHGPDKLQDYFMRVEPGNKLKLPSF